MKTTLLAVTGLSPAIVTETLWALARRNPPVLPERVGFITTATGAVRLEEQLFAKRPDWNDLSVWDALRKSLQAGPDQLIARAPDIISLPDATSGRTLPLDDLRTPAENAAAAEFIFSRVWDIVRDKDQRLIASVAGGRKTMGALLHSAVSLIGRENDLITHVLVSPPYDTLPGFFFPGQPDCPLHDTRSGKAHLAADAEITLAEVPFVPLRNRFKELDDLPGSFLALRAELSERLKQDAGRPVPLEIDRRRGELAVDGRRHKVRPRALAILLFILETNRDATIPIDQTSAADDFTAWFAHHRPAFAHLDETKFASDDIRRELDHLRGILKAAPWKPAKRTLLQAPFDLRVI